MGTGERTMLLVVAVFVAIFMFAMLVAPHVPMIAGE
jgi:hypothetical protein